MLPQTLRYLPVSVAYPAEYGVKDIKVTHTKLDDAEGEQMETNATVHTRSNVDKDDDQYINIPIRVPANLENTNDAEEQYVSMAIVDDSSINDQVDRGSIEGQTNVTVDHTIKDQVDLSKNSGGTDSTTSTKNNIEEVDIAKLRELIHDDNIDSDVHVELSSDSNRGDRIDSKLFDED
jgi:hypothetical protein